MSNRLEAIKKRKEYFEEQSKFQSYGIMRGLFVPNEDSYSNLLPAWNKMKVSEIIDWKIQQQGSCRILDVGCGMGKFLIDCKKKWKNSVTCEGLTAFDYRSQYMGGQDELVSLNISIRTGDAHELTRYVEPNSYDLVTSTMCFRYLSDPLLALRRVYSSLKIGGIGLIEGMELDFTDTTPRDQLNFFRHLKKEYGLYMRGLYGEHSAAFQKIKPSLRLPLSYGEGGESYRIQTQYLS